MGKTKKVFSTQALLVTLNQDKEAGILTQQDVDFALASWGNALEGKTLEEINELNDGNATSLRPEWFVEVPANLE